MRSMRGVVGASVLVLALPLTIVYQLIFSAGAEAFIHVCLALGAFLIAAAARDYRTPTRAVWLGCASAAALGVAFGLQALSESQATRRILGWVALLAAACAAVFSIGSIVVGASSAVPQVLRLVFLLPIVWLLLTSFQPRQQRAPARVVAPEPTPQSA